MPCKSIVSATEKCTVSFTESDTMASKILFWGSLSCKVFKNCRESLRLVTSLIFWLEIAQNAHSTSKACLIFIIIVLVLINILFITNVHTDIHTQLNRGVIKVPIRRRWKWDSSQEKRLVKRVKVLFVIYSMATNLEHRIGLYNR